MRMLKQLLGLGLAMALTLSPAFALADPDDRGPFELQPMVGYSWINLTGFSEDKFLAAAPEITPENAGAFDVDAQANSMLDASQVPVQGQGLSAGLGAQLKFWVFVLGARYAYTHTPDFGLHTVGGDLGMRVGGRLVRTG